MMGYFLKFLSKQTLPRLALQACVVSGVVTAAVACGSSDQPAISGVLPERAKPTTKTVTVNVEFPDGVQATTNSVHVWFIEKGDAGANCPDLVGGATDPNAGPIGHLGDYVTKNIGDPIVVKNVQNASSTLVYVEAVDDNGQVDWAGCVPLSKNTATVTLDKARVYDCAADGVREGAPCDDGDPCNVGESCKDGECQGGKRRDCTDLDDACNLGQCDPEQGCKKVPYQDGATCDDHLYCTTADKCLNGECVGTPKNCDTSSGGCRTGSTCDETLGGQCTTGTLQPFGTVCDDGKFCTTSDHCDSFGSCTGTPVDCSSSGGCLSCSEVSHGCTEPAPVGTYCSDSNNCTTSDQCDSTGKCVGKPLDCSSYNSPDGCRSGICDPTFGSCTYNYAPSGTACGAPCKIGGLCDGSGYCSYQTYASSGIPCDDKNPCTTGDQCDGLGSCYYTSYATTGTSCTTPSCTTGGTCSGSSSCYCP